MLIYIRPFVLNGAAGNAETVSTSYESGLFLQLNRDSPMHHNLFSYRKRPECLETEAEHGAPLNNFNGGSTDVFSLFFLVFSYMYSLTIYVFHRRGRQFLVE